MAENAASKSWTVGAGGPPGANSYNPLASPPKIMGGSRKPGAKEKKKPKWEVTAGSSYAADNELKVSKALNRSSQFNPMSPGGVIRDPEQGGIDALTGDTDAESKFRFKIKPGGSYGTSGAIGLDIAKGNAQKLSAGRYNPLAQNSALGGIAKVKSTNEPTGPATNYAGKLEHAAFESVRSQLESMQEKDLLMVQLVEDQKKTIDVFRRQFETMEQKNRALTDMLMANQKKMAELQAEVRKAAKDFEDARGEA